MQRPLFVEGSPLQFCPQSSNPSLRMNKMGILCVPWSAHSTPRTRVPRLSTGGVGVPPHKGACLLWEHRGDPPYGARNAKVQLAFLFSEACLSWLEQLVVRAAGLQRKRAERSACQVFTGERRAEVAKPSALLFLCGRFSRLSRSFRSVIPSRSEGKWSLSAVSRVVESPDVSCHRTLSIVRHDRRAPTR